MKCKVKGLALLLGLGLLAAGCAHDMRTVVIRPGPQANAGRRFFVMVRTVKEKDFLQDGYGKVAGMIFPESGDPSIKKVQLVWPGQKAQLVVKIPKKDAFAVYGLFTHPGDPWKLLFTPPLKDEYVISAKGGKLEVVPAEDEK